MRRTITYKFSSKEIVTDISGAVPDSVGKVLSYAKTQKIIFEEGIMYIQYFSHFLFFLEFTTFVLHSNLEASYINVKNRLLLIMMLEGKISLLKNDGIEIFRAESNTCFAAYNRKGEFNYALEAGKHQFCYIMPRTAWLNRKKDHYPRISQLLTSMKSGPELFGNLSPCKINFQLKAQLDQMFSLKLKNPPDLEIELTKCMMEITSQFQFLLDSKYAQRVYQIKDYIESNYTIAHLSNKIIADLFFTTEKTLIKTFKQEFGITPHSYLMIYRMEKAKTLMACQRVSPTQVYLIVGYSDFQSFRRQFRKHFGFPPSKVLNK